MRYEVNTGKGLPRIQARKMDFRAWDEQTRALIQVAFSQMKTVAATIIHNFKVEVIEGNKISPNCSVILYMKHGLKVKIS